MARRYATVFPYFVRHAMEPSEGCRIWPHAKARGYGIVDIHGKTIAVHILTCEAWHGPRPSIQYEVAHSCNNPSCWAGEHLRWATSKENHADRLVAGHVPHGEDHWLAKLTEADVRAIRARRAAGETQYALAAEYGVSRPTIAKIEKRLSWAWLP